MADASRPAKKAPSISVLLIQDNPEYAEKIKSGFSKSTTPFRIHTAMTLEQGLAVSTEHKIDVVLLELSLPDSSGLDTFVKVQSKLPGIPVVILTYLDDEMLALKAVRGGAQDYLLKSEIDAKILPRVIRYSIERQRMRDELLVQSVRDDLTGLYNRRGFILLAEQQMRLAYRNKKSLVLFLADLDGLKKINDSFGHLEGDQALVKAAQVLKKTFRHSDITARLGGDEFGIIAIDTNQEGIRVIQKRMEAHLIEANPPGVPYRLEISLGAAIYDPKNVVFVEQLIGRADKSLYEQKKKRQKI